MSFSRIATLRPQIFHTISGYFRLTNDTITTDTIIVVVPMYTNAVLMNAHYTPQVADGYANIYVRTNTGALPPDNSELYVAFILVKR